MRTNLLLVLAEVNLDELEEGPRWMGRALVMQPRGTSGYLDGTKDGWAFDLPYFIGPHRLWRIGCG